MILDEISLHDFGVYEGRQTLTLTPPSPKRPITLFTGLNGAGKTTALEALQIGLFGANAKCLSDQSYQEYIKRSINKKSQWKQSGVSLIFRQARNGQETSYRVTRVWKESGGKVSESLEVYLDDCLDRASTENWQQIVDEIIPSSISNFFFFDGEKIESYANPDAASELLREGIYSLLGLDVVNRLDDDLKILSRRRQSEKLPPSRTEELAEKEGALKSLREEIKLLVEKKAKLQTREIDVTERELKKVEKEYRKLGGDLYENRINLEKELVAAEHDLQGAEKRMQEIAGSELPLLLAKDLLEDLASYAAQAKELNASESVVVALEKRDADMLAHIRKTLDDQQAVKAIRKFCESDLQGRRADLQKNDCAYQDEGELAFLNPEAVVGRLEGMRSKANEQAVAYRACCDKVEEIKNQIASIPAEDSISSLLKQREMLRVKLAKSQAEHQQTEQEISSKQASEDQLSQAVETLWKEVAESELAQAGNRKYLGSMQNARALLARFADTKLAKNIRRVESLALESYQLLLRKESLVEKLKIDPSTFQISMVGKDGVPLEADQLSAGERQLFAIALLWGLGKASARPLPIAIDTPLGRLDSSHRTRLIDHYFSQASHQVLLFSTDEEIAGEYLKRLQPSIGKSYHLNYDDTSGSTNIVETVQ